MHIYKDRLEKLQVKSLLILLCGLKVEDIFFVVVGEGGLQGKLFLI